MKKNHGKWLEIQILGQLEHEDGHPGLWLAETF